MFARGKSRNTDKPTIIIGLTGRDLERLVAGCPITTNLDAEINVRANIIILAGNTEGEIARLLTGCCQEAGVNVQASMDAPDGFEKEEI